MAERGAKKFTARWIETVSVETRTDFTDPDVKGLALRVTPNGSKSWAYTYRRKSDGRKRRVTLGEFPAVSLHQARAKASGHRAAVAEGADPASDKTAHKKVETVDQLLDRYLTDYAPAESKWTAEVRRIFKKDVRPAIGGHKITAVTKADILAILNAVKDRGAGVTSNRTLAGVRKAFNWAVSEGYLKASPVQGIGAAGQGAIPLSRAVGSRDPRILDRSGQGQDGPGHEARASPRLGDRTADRRGLRRHEVGGQSRQGRMADPGKACKKSSRSFDPAVSYGCEALQAGI